MGRESDVHTLGPGVEYLGMAITALQRYTDEFDSTITADTEGGLPEGWLQLVVTWNGSTLVFSSMDNAAAWYDQNVPN